MFMPFQVLGIWLRGLISLAVIGIAVFLFYEWYTHRHHVVVERVDETVPDADALAGHLDAAFDELLDLAADA